MRKFDVILTEEADHDLGYELFKRFSQKITERLQATRLQLLSVNSIAM